MNSFLAGLMLLACYDDLAVGMWIDGAAVKWGTVLMLDLLRMDFRPVLTLPSVLKSRGYRKPGLLKHYYCLASGVSIPTSPSRVGVIY